MAEDKKVEPTTPAATPTETTHAKEVTKVHIPEKAKDEVKKA